MVISHCVSNVSSWYFWWNTCLSFLLTPMNGRVLPHMFDGLSLWDLIWYILIQGYFGNLRWRCFSKENLLLCLLRGRVFYRFFEKVCISNYNWHVSPIITLKITSRSFSIIILSDLCYVQNFNNGAFIWSRKLNTILKFDADWAEYDIIYYHTYTHVLVWPKDTLH